MLGRGGIHGKMGLYRKLRNRDLYTVTVAQLSCYGKADQE